jgi:hypothetical protein
MGSVGGMALPWLQGVLLELVHPSTSAWFTLAGAAVLFGLALAIRASLERTSSVERARSHSADSEKKVELHSNF